VKGGGAGGDEPDGYDKYGDNGAIALRASGFYDAVAAVTFSNALLHFYCVS
jgi:hypothetical protein